MRNLRCKCVFQNQHVCAGAAPELLRVARTPRIRLAARRGMTGATGNIYAGLHEFADMAFTLHFLRPDDLFLDVGANIGSYTLLASGVCKARTIAFEPDPQTMALLRRNIDLNGLDGRVLLEQTAVGAEDGEVEFTLGRDTCNQVTQGNAERTQRVSMRTLDTVAGLTPPTMIKVDVEGYEADVFRGAQVCSTHRYSRQSLPKVRGPLTSRYC